ncbi:sterol desaturase family protein [Pleionea sediminis]|uniref:sterol desaturase family protein n=1 Tax=Pleionea sediminis TaxID=2569479 RepID=UPI0013DE318E|nr:sterol desaturase family protein [Pleionea sediminis]
MSLIIGLIITAAIILGLIEWLRNKKLSKQNLISISTIPPNIVIYLVVAPYWEALYLWLNDFAVYSVSNIFIAFPLSLLLCDFSYYCEHRFAHKIPFLWRLYHGTHHTGQQFDIPLAFRVNGLNLFIAPLFYLPWLLLGIEPLVLLSAQLFVFHYQGWLHTELIGPNKVFDAIFNTPANHRVHHSKHHHGNFGGLFVIWDKLLGTYISPMDSIDYGLAGRTEDNSYLGIYADLWTRRRE